MFLGGVGSWVYQKSHVRGGVKLEIPWDEGALKGGLAISGFTKGGDPTLENTMTSLLLFLNKLSTFKHFILVY